MPTVRQALQSPLRQGSREILAYKFDFGRWGVPSNTPPFKLWNVTTTGMFDISATSLSGTSGITGSLAYSPYVVLLTDGMTYRLEAEAVINSNHLIGYLIITGEA